MILTDNFEYMHFKNHLMQLRYDNPKAITHELYQNLLKIFVVNVERLESFSKEIHLIELTENIKAKILDIGIISITARIYRYTISNQQNWCHPLIIRAFKAYLYAENYDDFKKRLEDIEKLSPEIKKVSLNYFSNCSPRAVKEMSLLSSTKRKFEKLQEDISLEEKESPDRKRRTLQRSNAATDNDLLYRLDVYRVINLVNRFLYPFTSGSKLKRDPEDCLMNELIHKFGPCQEVTKIAVKAYLERAAIWFLRSNEPSQKSPEEIKKLMIDMVSPSFKLDFPNLSLDPDQLHYHFTQAIIKVNFEMKEKQEWLKSFKDYVNSRNVENLDIIREQKKQEKIERKINKVIIDEITQNLTDDENTVEMAEDSLDETSNNELPFIYCREQKERGNELDAINYDYIKLQEWFESWCDPFDGGFFTQDFLQLLYTLSTKLDTLSPKELINKCITLTENLHFKKDVAKLEELALTQIGLHWPEGSFIGGSELFHLDEIEASYTDPKNEDYHIYEWYQAFTNGSIAFSHPFKINFLKAINKIVTEIKEHNFYHSFSAPSSMFYILKVINRENDLRGYKKQSFMKNVILK